MQSKHEQWAEQVARWQLSGLSQAQWCREQGLSLTRFSYWQRKLAHDRNSTVPAVLPIRVTQTVQNQRAEIHFPSGVSVTLSAADPVCLANLLRGVGAC